jgi:membrane fusion protein, heavy metal efflux system
MMNQPEHAPSSKQPTSRSERISLAFQLIVSFAVAGVVFFYLLLAGGKGDDDEKRPTPPEPVVTEVLPPREPPALRVKPDTAIFKKLVFDKVRRSKDLTEPVLPITGTALVSLRPGMDVKDNKGEDAVQDHWQFATSDLLQAFADWQKAVVDVKFQKTQRDQIVKLADYRVKAQTRIADQMKELVKAGTEREKDAFTEEFTLKQFEIQGSKEKHEAETAVTLATRAEATLRRQLQQAGLEPTALRSHAAEGEIVVADIPEQLLERVKVGMTCKVTFFALPDREFVGKVSSISPMINKDKRTAAVQFTVTDKDKKIRPGMFAVVRLITDQRALVMPADGVLHVGDDDYALKEADDGTWQIIKVRIGELRGTDVEVLKGLNEGDRVVGKGAILLKPVVVRALQAREANVPAADVDKAKKGAN